ncbi:ABC transporter ATP-binding protein [Sulfitobacter pseudonitzschiae]|uniref:ABC transporter ATP-binding protein n=1 Tax=Pseudosulfitobacter pseudonitzschiae TaxID=1402135 RepID=A0A9Q2NEI6_9RHOB|nr:MULTISPECIES: ABC transporter ATP-binding protein [Pseudosulfitobacter]MBM2290639.1 ABC transporter ATP-binding protein [Pseudosulfitobacter pseudonitzschiae]MBM2295557.1 ABC transporter ATP-binding protein [Pseudosulfitobacter pseudonitzschiae]MBM2300469.1 ABC transporter ATP-binding protein [Pseudosulfitobacter pseudonitzschiae]MBM2310254.1 ABC transporter ATP-binding protein [Pseudosulfitobacter pseudonitzschiae]MBM2315166.1 ABC transporter ATP-binding protein [Pseudosulfitobacter pseudo|tara:strand:- start:273962 stop:275800 length:1839 start_codon:yes stop_codon:yes gene_type:complete
MFKFFENLVDPYAPFAETNTPPTRLWPFMREYAKPFKTVFVLTGILSIVIAAIEIGLIYYMGRVVDLLQGTPSEVWAAHKVELIAVAIFILTLRPLIQLLDVMLLNNTIIVNFGTLIRWRSHKHVLRQSVGWFENDFAGRIANRIMQTPPAAGEVVFQVFDAISYSLAYMIGAAILLSTSDARLLLPLVIWMVLYGLLINWTTRRVGPASKAASDARSAVTGRVVDAYTNIHSVKMFAHHDSELNYAKEAIEHTRKTFQTEMRIFTTMDFSLVVLNGLLIVGVVGWAIALWVQGQASVGTVAAATALALRLNAMTGWIMWALTTFFRELGVVAEGMETIAQPVTLVDAPKAKPLALTDGRIELKALTHHYGRASGGLEAIDLTIQPGEKVGLIGRSGAGKSTLVKLLLRFYDPESGRIEIDGQDITKVTQDSLRLSVGMVQQESSLLHRSVRENILYGKPDATEAEMIAAAKQAEAHDFITTLTDPAGNVGYDAQVGERGVKLSGGQRQRVTLARVILKNAPILLLDEATSALDSEVEEAIQGTLYKMMEGKTVIAIAHRLSTIAEMDRILVLDAGKIIEDGSHDALLAKGGLYSQFWTRQSGGFLNPEDPA